MFATLSRSWEYAKLSYSVLWHHKHLLVFPVVSAAAAALVSASFLLPLWSAGVFERLTERAGDASRDPLVYVGAFIFYFCNYFVIVFFNTALTAAALRIVGGEPASIGYGLSVAGRRLPQILGWAVVSAAVGVALKAIENANDKAGRFVSAILGMGWTAMTYFVVPLIAVEGVGPVDAVKQSASVLRETWGEALVGNFSLGFLGFLLALPGIVLLLVFGLLAGPSLGTAGIVVLVALGVLLLLVAAAASSAADVIFKALLYHHATDGRLPEGVDRDALAGAFAPRS